MREFNLLSLLCAFLAYAPLAESETFFPTTKANINHVNSPVPARTAKIDLKNFRIDSPITPILIPRGGSIAIEDDEGTFVMKKLRNIIRSVLKVGDKKIPIVAKVMRGLLGCVETVSGIDLLPKVKNDKKKGKNVKSKKGTKKNIESKDDDSKKKAAARKAQKNNGQAQSHLSKDLKTSNPNYRIQRELKEFMRAPPPNLSVKVGKNIRVWIITMEGTKGSLYEGEKYRLRVQFPANYPTEPPSVYFLQPTPRHEHVYTNGDICLSLLGKDWRPNMTAQSIAMSILSILSGAGRKSLPMDNAAHAQNKPGQKQDDWVYHDDNC